MNESCHTYESVMSHILIVLNDMNESYVFTVTHMKESFHISEKST